MTPALKMIPDSRKIPFTIFSLVCLLHTFSNAHLFTLRAHGRFDPVHTSDKEHNTTSISDENTEDEQNRGGENSSKFICIEKNNGKYFKWQIEMFLQTTVENIISNVC